MSTHAERLAEVDPTTLDPETLWFRMLATKQVIEEFEATGDAGPAELAAFIRDLKLALDGDVLQDEISGKLMRFRPGQGRLLMALLRGQVTVDCDEDGGDVS